MKEDFEKESKEFRAGLNDFTSWDNFYKKIAEAFARIATESWNRAIEEAEKIAELHKDEDYCNEDGHQLADCVYEISNAISRLRKEVRDA